MRRQKRKPHSKAWRKKADVLWSQIIRLPGKCAICGRTTSLQAHHLIHKSAVFFRHNLENGICLCARCHEYAYSTDKQPGAVSAHGSPWAFEKWMQEHRPQQFDWWQKNRWEVITGKRIDYEAIYDNLEAVLEAADGD